MVTDEYIREIVDGVPFTVYSTSNMKRAEYPYILQHISYSTGSYVEDADKYVLDSRVGEETTNEEIIEEAERIGATTVVPADEVGDVETTVEKTHDMERRIQKSGVVEDMFVPIQEDDEYSRKDHVNMLGVDDAVVHTYAIGGINELSFDEQIVAATVTYSAVGDPIHPFGVGCSEQWLGFFNDCRDIVKSIDLSTPEQMAINSNVLSGDMKQIGIDFDGGKHSSTIRAKLAETNMLLFLYHLTDFSNAESHLTEEQLQQVKECL